MLELDFLLLCYLMGHRILLDHHKTKSVLDLHSLVPFVPFVITPQLIFLYAPSLYQLLLMLTSHFPSSFFGLLLLLFSSLLLLFSSWPLTLLSFFLLLQLLATLPLLRLIYVPLLSFSLQPPLIASLVAHHPFPSSQQ